MEISRPPVPVLALALVALALAPATAHAAVGVAYVDGGNIQVATVDGATKTALTSDGAANRDYSAVAHTADGRVFAAIGDGSTGLKQFAQFSPLGAKLSEYPAPYDNLGGWTSTAIPLGFEVDSAVTNIAYGYSELRFGIPTSTQERGTWVAPADHSAGMPPFENEGVNRPTFLGQRIVGVDNGKGQVSIQDAANAPYQNTYTPWLSDGGSPTVDLERVQIAPNGTTYAIEYTSSGTRGIELHRHEGAAPPGGTDTIACEFPAGPNPERVTFSPDSTLVAWKDDQGVKVARVPDLTAPGPTCPPPAPPAILSATGTSPALGGIDVPALVASRQGTTNPPPCTDCNPPPCTTCGPPPCTLPTCVADPCFTCPVKDTAAPVFTAAPKLTPSSFAPGTGATLAAKKKKPAPRGSTLTLTLSEAATLTATITQSATGRRVKGKCVAPTRSNRKSPSCTRTVPVGGATSKSVPRGAVKLKFSGRTGGKALKPGAYVLTLLATDAARNRSAPRTVRFTIVK